MTTTTLSPVELAREEAQRRAADYDQAKAALVEQVRTSDGYVAGGIVDQVAETTKLSASVVQRALFDLIRNGLLATNNDLAIVQGSVAS